MGRCPDCGEWNSLVEVTEPQTRERSVSAAPGVRPQRLTEVTLGDMARLRVEMQEFERVMGGGIVPGSLVLLRPCARSESSSTPRRACVAPSRASAMRARRGTFGRSF